MWRQIALLDVAFGQRYIYRAGTLKCCLSDFYTDLWPAKKCQSLAWVWMSSLLVFSCLAENARWRSGDCRLSSGDSSNLFVAWSLQSYMTVRSEQWLIWWRMSLCTKLVHYCAGVKRDVLTEPDHNASPSTDTDQRKRQKVKDDAGWDLRCLPCMLSTRLCTSGPLLS